MSSGESDGRYASKMRLQGLAAESVPYPHETNGYWYTRYIKLRDAIEKADHFLNKVGDPIACHIVLWSALEEEGVVHDEFQKAQTKP